MPVQDPQPEPSMEEILASIRRIISEEDDAPPAPAPVLDLTEAAEEEEYAPAPIAKAPAKEPVQDDIVFDEVAEIAPAAPAAPMRAPAAPETETIISAPAASAAAGALARLASTLRISETQHQTLEGLVREMLKPMLREWLDQNLPHIVESRVEAELERIARMSR